MSKSRFVFDKFAKLIEQGLINYKDVSDEVISILKSKRDEIVFKMKLASKEEVDVLNKRISVLEKKLEEKKKRKNTSKVKTSSLSNHLILIY